MFQDKPTRIYKKIDIKKTKAAINKKEKKKDNYNENEIEKSK